ncbi:MAG: metallopeptidase [Stomatobaculum sp.]|nr:metallopeptidase [Stomatobaculum sp.]
MKQREALENAGKRILVYTKTELTLSMRFLSAALDRLPYRMDLRTRSIGTDGSEILFHPNWLLSNFVEHPLRLNRACLHMLMHCLFRHMYGAPFHKDEKLWDLSCDIAAESVLDSMKEKRVLQLPNDFREETYRTLTEELGVLTAEKLYRYFTDRSSKEKDPEKGDAAAFWDLQERLEKEFRVCDHGFWDREGDKDPKDPPAMEIPRRPQEKEWEKTAKRVRTELETFGKEAGKDGELLERVLRFSYRERPLYRDFLEHLAVLRETSETDPDSFDYAYYYYGLERYGNMPLIEENELREVKKVEELVIAIDTSASCQAVLVQKFLEETAAVLAEKSSFFRRVRIHLIECDDRIQKDTLLESPEELKKTAGIFAVHGGGGTDFRPVFRHVQMLREQGELKDLRGLIYFTDGYGVYPEKATDYETAFVFREDQDHGDAKVPDWALKLYLQQEDA